MKLFGAIDWGSEEHAVCVIDALAQVVWRGKFRHTADGLAELCRRLERLAPVGELPIAIERPSGLLVDTLVAAGFPVVPIHPNVVKASRPRYSAVQGKTDDGDAFMIADILRTDGHRLRPLQPLSDETKALRTLVRTRDDLVELRVALVNQLRALLDTFWPGAGAIFADLDSPIALVFIRRFPTPSAAARLGEKRLTAFLAGHGYCGRRSAAELLERLRREPVGQTGDSECAAKGAAVLALVAVLEPLVAQIGALSVAVERAVEAHTDGAILMSFPRAGRVNAAQILAELGDDRSRFVSPDHLAAEAGAAPVTYESGKHRGVGFRWACNKRLRRALTMWADNSRHASAWAASVYRAARDRGCDHPHAIRILARAWVRVLWRCWQNRQPYDERAHRAAQPSLTKLKEAA
jgi:transposase